MRQIFEVEKDEESQWVSISDLMSVLMMIFLFIAVTYMLHVVKEKEKIKEVAVTYNKLQTELFEDLSNEFRNDLKLWNASIDRQSLSVRFEAPEVLFTPGSPVIQPQFKQILADFFPRYIGILMSEKYRQDIEEIRIEGHTSSEWSFEVPKDRAYFYNMELSQNRTRNVLEYALMLPKIKDSRQWIREKLTANGLASSKLVLKDGKEDKERSRRVEFRVRTNAESRIVRILTADN